MISLLKYMIYKRNLKDIDIDLKMRQVPYDNKSLGGHIKRLRTEVEEFESNHVFKEDNSNPVRVNIYNKESNLIIGWIDKEFIEETDLTVIVS